MRTWLTESLARCSLSEEARSYLYRRGCDDTRMETLGLTCWSVPDTRCPDDEFCRKFGERGERLCGRLVAPYWSGRAQLLGMEVRSFKPGTKYISDVRTTEAHWNSAWIGLRDGMPKLWKNGFVWIVEGLFDLVALSRVVPPGDAVLAALTARVSQSQREFLERFAKYVFVVFDMDSAGERGRVSTLKWIEKTRLRFFPVTYRGGKDPGEIWDEGGDDGLYRAFEGIIRMRRSYGSL